LVNHPKIEIKCLVCFGFWNISCDPRFRIFILTHKFWVYKMPAKIVYVQFCCSSYTLLATSGLYFLSVVWLVDLIGCWCIWCLCIKTASCWHDCQLIWIWYREVCFLSRSPKRQ
jgi:hypothetical protein